MAKTAPKSLRSEGGPKKLSQLFVVVVVVIYQTSSTSICEPAHKSHSIDLNIVLSKVCTLTNAPAIFCF